MMQAPGPSQRSMQRRSPGAEPGPPPNVPVRSMSPGTGLAGPAQGRVSTASNRSTGSSGGGGSGAGSQRRTNSSGTSAMPLSQIEKSVTHLLVATKQLLETLTQWSRGQATDSQVSDVYVRLGYEFNMACRAFTAINVDTSDLGNVPEKLRNILEATLSQEASVESLENYLPKIRDIIINLLHGLKRKQQRLRQRQSRDKENVAGSANEPSSSSGSSRDPTRTTSTSTTGSANSGLTTLLSEGIENGYRPDLQQPNDSKANSSPSRRFVVPRDPSRGSLASDQSSMSSNTMQNIPVLPPYPGDETIPAGPAGNDLNIDSFPPPPPPPKSQQSAFAALQRGGDLERRASRRYSAYQISKHLGNGANGIPMLPPQTTPVPNRGRGEVRESMRAVQGRTTADGQRQIRTAVPTGHPRAGNRLDSSSPVRVPARVPEDREPSAEPADDSRSSPVIQTPDDKYPQPSATLRGPPVDAYPVYGSPEESPQRTRTVTPPPSSSASATEKAASTPEKQRPFVVEQSPPTSTKELTLFLQYKSKVKKFVLPEGYSELSIGRLQLAFIDKFSWNTQQNGVDLPEIYIQDPVSGVRHELEDLADIKDRTVLVLNVEALDEVKRHIDEGLGSLKAMVKEVKLNVDDQASALQRVSDRQQEAAKEIARLAAAPPQAPMTPPADSPRSSSTTTTSSSRKANLGQLSELRSLRRDLAVLRQTYSNFQSEINGSMASLRSKASSVKVAAAKLAVPDVEGGSGHAYVVKGRKELNTDSDRLVTKVDDLQDMVEDLRKDVVHRGVRPLPRQLETAARDIASLTKELRKMEDYMKREKPIWTKIWEKELEDVCQGREELRIMEDLLVDLQDDLEKASETFGLVEAATKEQMKDAGVPGGAGGGGANAAPMSFAARQFSRGLENLGGGGGDKEGVLGGIRALQPNHEDRLEAIERAEKLRQKELQSRRENPLTRELGEFVGEGKLKKSGGFEEVERARKAKDDRIRKEVWERQNGGVAAAADDDDDDDEEETTEESSSSEGTESPVVAVPAG